MGQNVIHGDHTENGSVFNGKVSVKNGRPMRVFNFKLTPAVLDMRVCKPEGGRRYVICMGTKEFRGGKVVGGGLEITKTSGGLFKAQSVATVPSLSEGILVNPKSVEEVSVAVLLIPYRTGRYGRNIPYRLVIRYG